MSGESNLTICKKCREVKKRINVGKFNSKEKKYTDENNKLWNGLKCPECVVIDQKERMRAKRENNKKSN